MTNNNTTPAPKSAASHVSQPRDISATHKRAYIGEIDDNIYYFKTETEARVAGAKEAHPCMVSNDFYDSL